MMPNIFFTQRDSSAYALRYQDRSLVTNGGSDHERRAHSCEGYHYLKCQCTWMALARTWSGSVGACSRQ